MFIVDPVYLFVALDLKLVVLLEEKVPSFGSVFLPFLGRVSIPRSTLTRTGSRVGHPGREYWITPRRGTDFRTFEDKGS